MFPKNEPARSWSEERLLREIAENYCRTEIVPRLVAAWEAAGKAPAPTVRESSPPDADMADIIVDRSHHDAEDAPAGPHTLPATPDVPTSAPQQPAERVETSPAVPAPTGQETAPAPSAGAPADDLGELSQTAAAANGEDKPPEVPPAAAPPDDRKSVAEGRQAVLAAFARNRTPPQPQAPQARPWFSGPEAPQPKSDMSDDGWRFVLEGYVAGNLAWAAKHGPPPRAEGCRVPTRILREFRL
jgi:hypothetical protein